MNSSAAGWMRCPPRWRFRSDPRPTRAATPLGLLAIHRGWPHRGRRRPAGGGALLPGGNFAAPSSRKRRDVDYWVGVTVYGWGPGVIAPAEPHEPQASIGAQSGVQIGAHAGAQIAGAHGSHTSARRHGHRQRQPTVLLASITTAVSTSNFLMIGVSSPNGGVPSAASGPCRTRPQRPARRVLAVPQAKLTLQINLMRSKQCLVVIARCPMPT